MPMNQFLFDHQLAAMKIDTSESADKRSETVELMGAHAKRIADWRKAKGLSNMGWPSDERPPAQRDE